MDSDSWAGIASSSRRYVSRSEFYHGDEFEGEEEPRPEFLCPFCAEEFDMVGLCCHIDEEHAIEAKNGVCPVCTKKVGLGLIRHMTKQHGDLLKVQRRRKFRKAGSNFPFSFLRKELREGNLQTLLGGSSFIPPPVKMERDPLFTSSFIYSPSPADETPTSQTLSQVEACSSEESSAEDLTDRAIFEQSPPLSDEDLKEKSRRCEFVRGLLLSTFLDDGL